MSFLSVLSKRPNRKKKLSLSGLSSTKTRKRKTTRKKATNTRRKTATRRKSGNNAGTTKLKKIQARAKKIRRANESHAQAVSRASKQLKAEGAI
jgi:hypothetical protein